MTVYELCKEEACDQLCAIRKDGEIIEFVWGGFEDVSRLYDSLGNAEVKEATFSALQILDRDGNKYKVPCLFIDI